MTKEDKELLCKDLCARLPYGVKVHIEYGDIPYGPATVRQIDIEHSRFIFNFPVPIENGKPYLRPMLSMTKEERNEATQFEIINLGPIGFNWGLLVSNSSELVNWLNSHHFDYRGLIEKGLALEAPEGMYKTE